MKYIMLMASLMANLAVPLYGMGGLEIKQVARSVFSPLQSPTSVSFSPVMNDRVYAVIDNHQNNTVSVYVVDQETGAFTQVGMPVATG